LKEKHQEKQKDKEEKQEKDKVEISKKEYEDLLSCKDAKKEISYLHAEFENFKKRHIKDLKTQIDYANEKLILELLPIIDNLVLAKNHAKDSDGKDSIEGFLKGVELILKQMKETLKKFGVEEISCLGKNFDPSVHEAMEQRESEEHNKGIILEEYQRGYRYKNRVIRPSKVCISKENKKINKEKVKEENKDE
jgi:molecular chaperone GrpE